MSEFQELIKSFGKSRDYVRDFFVYGFKSRQDFTSSKKSARTYDDERRRITSWLGEYVEEDTTESKGSRVKNISLVIDSNLLDENPLFAVWKTKSFTDNDVTYFFGDITKHPDYENIKVFCENHHVKIEIICKKEPLTDIGGIVL